MKPLLRHDRGGGSSDPCVQGRDRGNASEPLSETGSRACRPEVAALQVLGVWELPERLAVAQWDQDVDRMANDADHLPRRVTDRRLRGPEATLSPRRTHPLSEHQQQSRNHHYSIGQGWAEPAEKEHGLQTPITEDVATALSNERL